MRTTILATLTILATACSSAPASTHDTLTAEGCALQDFAPDSGAACSAGWDCHADAGAPAAGCAPAAASGPAAGLWCCPQ